MSDEEQTSLDLLKELLAGIEQTKRTQERRRMLDAQLQKLDAKDHFFAVVRNHRHCVVSMYVQDDDDNF